ncbi:MarR family winged helix-turn-helix transcriptional regulator [Streptomyces sp. NPDC050145]|uniref:MarR family winged helix-turn-helix transcriptional regulator n=1 Tax=Streptomyces sp. NPDC050145 TaxID=3365602 RepID=UPI00378B6194
MEQMPERMAARPSWLITQLAVHTRRLVFDAFADAGGRGHHYRVLAVLDEFGATSQAELGRRARMDRSDVVAAVDALVGQDLADRAPDPDHGRRNRITLTQSGVRHLRRLDDVVEQVQDELLQSLSAEDRRTLTRLLRQVLDQHEPA